MHHLSPQDTDGKKTILIVEDNSLNMKLFRDVLESQGFDVLGSAHGKDAYGIVKQQKPDLILMDIQLSGISGYDVIEQIKRDAATADVPIIAVTAYAMREDERKVR